MKGWTFKKILLSDLPQIFMLKSPFFQFLLILYKFLLGFVNEDDTFLIFLFRFGLTAVYLFAIQRFTRIGGKISVKLIKYENNETAEKRADSLVYKVLTRIFIHPLWLFLSLYGRFTALQDHNCSCRSLVFISCRHILEFSIMLSCTAIF